MIFDSTQYIGPLIHFVSLIFVHTYNINTRPYSNSILLNRFFMNTFFCVSIIFLKQSSSILQKYILPLIRKNSNITTDPLSFFISVHYNRSCLSLSLSLSLIRNCYISSETHTTYHCHSSTSEQEFRLISS